MKEVLKFKAVWCGPCKSLSNIMEGTDFGVKVTEVDIDEDMATAQKYAVRGVPTMVLLDEGKEVSRLVGVHQLDKIQKWIEG